MKKEHTPARQPASAPQDTAAPDTNPRNVPDPDMDSTPPQENLPDVTDPGLQEQDTTPVDPDKVIHPKPEEKEVLRRERIVG